MWNKRLKHIKVNKLVLNNCWIKPWTFQKNLNRPFDSELHV